VSRKTDAKFNITNLSDIFVTPEDLVDSIKSEKDSLDQIYKYFGEGETPKREYARLNLLSYLRSELPQYNFYAAGHGCI